MARSFIRGFTCALAAAVLANATAQAQETRGAIAGTVRDSSGGVLPRVTIVIAHEDTNPAHPLPSLPLRDYAAGTVRVGRAIEYPDPTMPSRVTGPLVF